MKHFATLHATCFTRRSKSQVSVSGVKDELSHLKQEETKIRTDHRNIFDVFKILQVRTQ